MTLCEYDIHRGDWLDTVEGRFRITRFDAEEEVIVCTDGARTRQVPLYHLAEGRVFIDRVLRDPAHRLKHR